VLLMWAMKSAQLLRMNLDYSLGLVQRGLRQIRKEQNLRRVDSGLILAGRGWNNLLFGLLLGYWLLPTNYRLHLRNCLTRHIHQVEGCKNCLVNYYK
jgi:hypothetical protein